MSSFDILIFLVYMISMLGVGYYFSRRNKSQDDYYVGNREMSSLHIGLSVVATDVGGTTLFLIIANYSLPYNLDANFFGISISAVTFVLIHFLTKKQ